jgi:hypothetical protein
LIQPGVCTSSTRPTSPFTGQYIFETDTLNTLVYNGTAFVCLTPQSSTQDASVNNPSGTTFAASSGSDPTVTLQTGTKALVTISVRISAASNYHFVGCAVSGATTLAATDANSATIGAVGGASSASTTFLLTGLTSGSNTFTMRYRCNVSASGSYDYRKLTVVGIP